jgi:hypothetical protein
MSGSWQRIWHFQILEFAEYAANYLIQYSLDSLAHVLAGIACGERSYPWIYSSYEIRFSHGPIDECR